MRRGPLLGVGGSPYGRVPGVLLKPLRVSAEERCAVKGFVRLIRRREALGRRCLLPAALLVAGMALYGCATGQKVAGSPDARMVAQEFGMFYATVVATEDEPATSAQIKALARQLAVRCAPPREGQYPCLVHLPGGVPATQHCVAVVTPTGPVTGRCSEGDAPAPVVTTGYVDCASVGRIVTISDPAGDEKRVVLLASQRLVRAVDPRADLVEVRVAATPTRFCADFRTLAPLIVGSWIGLNMKQAGAPDLEFAPTINWRLSLGPQLESPVNDPIAGKLGIQGDWTSVVITSADTAASLPRAPFQSSAYANHETETGHLVGLTTDSTPDRPRYQTYP